MRLHTIFFYLFLLSVPFQTRKVFLGDYSFYGGSFSEYATYFIYLSDIFLILALLSWLMSRKRLSYNKPRRRLTDHRILTYLVLFFSLLVFGLVFKRDYFAISLYQFLKLFEVSLLFLYVYYNLGKEKVLINALFLIAVSGFVQALIAISQFVQQGSIFSSSPIFQKMTGESFLNLYISGVAKFIVEGQKVIRPYGTFPHPNILAGFLIFSLLATIYLYLESKQDKLSSKFYLGKYYSMKGSKSQHLFYSLSWILLIFIQLAALFLTFSRSAWLSFSVSVVVVTIFYVSRETIKINSFLHRLIKFIALYKEMFTVVALFMCLLVSQLSFISSRVNEDIYQKGNVPNNSALSDRKFFNDVSRETISKNVLLGSGLGTFIFQIDDYLERNNIEQELNPWQYQPAHNIYFLVASEIGILGLLFFLLFIFKIISRSIRTLTLSVDKKFNNEDYFVSHETKYMNNPRLSYFLLVVILSFLLIGLFDHYFWTLQQGMLIFWFVLGLIAVNSKD